MMADRYTAHSNLANMGKDKERKSRYADLFLRNSPDMFFVFDEQLCLIVCSEACLPLLADQKPLDLENKPLGDIFSSALEDDWIQKISQQNSTVLSTLSRRHFDDTLTFGDREPMHVQVAISPILDETEKCCGTIMTVRDITELVETKRHAEDAARSKSSFLANMSHEIRTPMNAVKGLSELLALTELNSLQRNYVKNIIDSANSLLGIINDVLDFSKIDANKIEFIENPYDLANLIIGVCNVVSMRADDRDILLLVDAPPDLPLSLLGDDVRIKQVIINLLSNAVKYTKEGYVRLGVHTEKRDGANWLYFTVEDSGIGIQEENIHILFDAFYRADLHSNRSIAGTGLGLAISKQLALAMGGDIEVASVRGKGSTFTFYIPQKIVDPRPLAQVNDPENKRVLLLGAGEYMYNLGGMIESLGVSYTHKEAQDMLEGIDFSIYTHCISDGSFSERLIRSLYGQMPNCLFAALKNIRYAMSISDYQDTILYLPVFIAKLSLFLNRDMKVAKNLLVSETADKEIALRDVRVLAVDDNEINLIVSSEMLRSFGADVADAKNGDEAIRLCQDNKFDIIFMDHMMPGKDGIETTKEIRESQGLNCETPIIALTANVVNDMKSVYLSSGMDDFIGKPIELSDISRILRLWLPKEKIGMLQATSSTESVGVCTELLTPTDLIDALDNFGLYSSDVMREMDGDFNGYILRMEEASKVLDGLVSRLKAEVSEKRWDDFARDCLELYDLLYGIGARDCAARARELAIAGRARNVDYIYEDFFSLMGNMYMLDKKLVVIVPFAHGGDTQDLPLGSPQFLHGCLEKMGRALLNSNAVEAMVQLENAVSFSLDMELDMALKAIKADLEKGDFESAIEHHAAIFRMYTEQIANS